MSVAKASFPFFRRLQGAVALLFVGIAFAAAPVPDAHADALACGNGILETGEHCDGGACCDDTCRFARVGTACDDLDSCTIGDSCSSNGICIGAAKDCSRLSGSCSAGRCVDGACVVVAANDGKACDDKDACTSEDVCRAGDCTGARLDCSAFDGPCSIGACTNDGVCRAIGIHDDAPCDDGDACTGDDRCRNGSCAGTAADCSHLDGICKVGVCRPGGECAVEPNDGAPCDDGDPCTSVDTCSAGDCLGTVIDCSYLNDGCVVGFCDASGTCAAREAGEGEACNDGNPCTDGDVCSDSICAGVATDCSAADNACSRGVCDTLLGCIAEPINEGLACVDGDACTTGDTCRAGFCSGAAVDCSALDEGCLVGACQPDGRCATVPIDDGTPCDDRDPCTITDTCNDTRCIGFPTDCSALDDACSVGHCQDDGQCRAVARDNGTACNDGNACTIHDECLGGVCIGGAPTECDDGVACTQDRCVPTRGCLHEAEDEDCLGRCAVVEPCDDGPCQAPRHAVVTIVTRDQGATTLLIGAWVPVGDAVPQPQATGLRIDLSNEGGDPLLALALAPDAFEVARSSIRLGDLEYGARKKHRTLRQLELGFDDAVGSVRLHAKLKGRALTLPTDGDRLSLAVAFGPTTESTCVQWPTLTCRLTLSTWSVNDSVASKRRYSCTSGTARAWTKRIQERRR